jgi:hypothetical protein
MLFSFVVFESSEISLYAGLCTFSDRFIVFDTSVEVSKPGDFLLFFTFALTTAAIGLLLCEWNIALELLLSDVLVDDASASESFDICSNCCMLKHDDELLVPIFCKMKI